VPEAEAPVKWKLSNSYTHSGTNNGKAMENSWKYEIYYIFIYIYKQLGKLFLRGNPSGHKGHKAEMVWMDLIDETLNNPLPAPAPWLDRLLNQGTASYCSGGHWESAASSSHHLRK
jgi:hypothetical protein